MKNIFSRIAPIALGALLLTVCTRAENLNQSGPHRPMDALLSGGTNNIAAASTNVYNYIFPCAEYDKVGVSLTMAAVAPCTGNVLVRIGRAMAIKDGVILVESVPAFSMLIPLTGATPVTFGAPIDASGATWLSIVSMENTNSVAVTNIAIGWNLQVVKRGAWQATQ